MISNKIESEAWDALEGLVLFLERDEDLATKRELFSWKNKAAFLATAKEAYGWRKVIDSIKASDLDRVSSELQRSGNQSYALAKSKPIMLRISGEITNALIHSYNNRHTISFFQCASKDPSGLPT